MKQLNSVTDNGSNNEVWIWRSEQHKQTRAYVCATFTYYLLT